MPVEIALKLWGYEGIFSLVWREKAAYVIVIHKNYPDCLVIKMTITKEFAGFSYSQRAVMFISYFLFLHIHLRVIIHIFLYSVLYPQHLEKWLIHSKCKVNIHEWMKEGKNEYKDVILQHWIEKHFSFITVFFSCLQLAV